MVMDGGLRISTPRGAMLADPAWVGKLTEPDWYFDPEYWKSRGESMPVSGGRGSAWFINFGGEQWVLRHYRRGGLVARVAADRYLWCGERRVRAFAEWRLLAILSARGLPVPRPVAARYQRSGLWYRCDLITQRIPDSTPLSALLMVAALGKDQWTAVGQAIARLHAAGVDHADLNAHNILVDGQGVVSIIDFDRCRLRAPGDWRADNLNRLRRSLRKIGRDLPQERFAAQEWTDLITGYRAG